MTNLVYHNQLYRNFTPGGSIIVDLEKHYISQLISACKPTDLFVNSIWFEYDEQMVDLLKSKPSRIVVYSGMDWHDTGYRKHVHDKLHEHCDNVIYVGNTDGQYYFSFWLFFIKTYYNNFYTTTPENLKIDKLFMCLNRKRHDHRVQLVEQIFNEKLDQFGYVTLGGDLHSNLPPITLENDIVNTEGDKTAGDSKEGITNDISSLGNKLYWNNHLINIVTETTIHSSTFISEKTWKPILGLKPFMILGDEKIYSYLKQYGIDTFDDIFGTGYGSKNWIDRKNWIVENLHKFKDVNYNQIYTQLLPRLIRNRDLVKEIIKSNTNTYTKILETLSN